MRKGSFSYTNGLDRVELCPGSRFSCWMWKVSWDNTVMNWHFKWNWIELNWNTSRKWRQHLHFYWPINIHEKLREPTSARGCVSEKKREHWCYYLSLLLLFIKSVGISHTAGGECLFLCVCSSTVSSREQWRLTAAGRGQDPAVYVCVRVCLCAPVFTCSH